MITALDFDVRSLVSILKSFPVGEAGWACGTIIDKLDTRDAFRAHRSDLYG